ncbi:MAG: poly-gamma-glutamate hydrolase family protein [Steroidobacteraceae bacterium]|jgi:phage replication-related protein YjqB (UPF0714/DUF867 family)
MQQSTIRARTGKYGSFAELARHEIAGKDYRVEVVERVAASVLVVAPHGGMIEAGTSEIAASIAGGDFHLFNFEGLKPYGQNRTLHITSHRFDHPHCLALASHSQVVLSVHGCLGESCIHVGGLDEKLTDRLTAELSAAAFNVVSPSPRYPGRHPGNICNRGSSGKGAQLEITYDLRTSGRTEAIARAVRAALTATG